VSGIHEYGWPTLSVHSPVPVERHGASDVDNIDSCGVSHQGALKHGGLRWFAIYDPVSQYRKIIEAMDRLDLAA